LYKIALNIWGLWRVHTNFGSACSVSVSNVISVNFY
jgi:hypothetical protein